ncbi:MAG: PAS domain S-box protein, partial [Alphaproteobacteria bacterium]|nr:PAS domain S-box protein [Alphaproteobacteria bacterium]
FSFENRQIAEDGQIHHMSWNTRPIHASSGEVVQFASIARDITDRYNAERTLLKTVDTLTNSNTELERFAFVASHDLREPVRTLVAFSQLLPRQVGTIAQDAQQSLDMIIQAAKRMDALVLDLLTYSQVSSHAQSFNPVDMNVVLQNVFSDLKTTLLESGAEINHDKLPIVLGDQLQLHHLFMNIIGNALKFSSKGQRPVVSIRASEQDEACEIAISDNGIGIEPQYADQIFVIFKRLHTIMDYPGTGVGLAICKRIVERHRGRIWVESDGINKGSTFKLSLPTPGNT